MNLSFEFAFADRERKVSILEEGRAAENILAVRQIRLKDYAFQRFVWDIQAEIHKLTKRYSLSLHDHDDQRWSAYRADDSAQVLLIYFDTLHHEVVFEKTIAPLVNLTLRVERVVGNRPVYTVRKGGVEQGGVRSVDDDLIRQAIEALK